MKCSPIFKKATEIVLMCCQSKTIPPTNSCSRVCSPHSETLPIRRKGETIKAQLWLALLLPTLLYSLFRGVCPVELSISHPSLQVVPPESRLWPGDMCLLQPLLWWQAAWGPSLPSPANGSRRPVVTGRLCAERHHFFPFIPAVASWPSSPYPSCLSESRWTAEGQSPWACFFLGEQRAITTRLSGSSNMAPALRHMGWLAGLCVLSVWVYMCVLGECDASPNANACCFKKMGASLSSSVFPLWKGLLWPSGAGSYFFFLFKRKNSQKDAPVIHFENYWSAHEENHFWNSVFFCMGPFWFMCENVHYLYMLIWCAQKHTPMWFTICKIPAYHLHQHPCNSTY